MNFVTQSLDPGVPSPSLPKREKMQTPPSRIGEKFSAIIQESFGFFKTLGNLRSIIMFNGAWAAVSAPLKVVAIAKRVIAFPGYNREKRIDAGLQICDLVRQIGEGVVTVIVSLERLKKIAYTSGVWARPLAPVLSVFSIAVIANNVRVCMRMRRLMKEMDQVVTKEKTTFQRYYAIVNLISQKQKEDKEFASDTFNLNIEQLEGALSETQAICNKLNSEELGNKEEAERLLQEAIKGLRGRVKKNITSSMFSVVSSIASIVGTIVLLLSPLSPIGWVVVGGAIAVDTGSWLHHKVKEYQFAKSVALKRTKLQWITC